MYESADRTIALDSSCLVTLIVSGSRSRRSHGYEAASKCSNAFRQWLPAVCEKWVTSALNWLVFMSCKLNSYHPQQEKPLKNHQSIQSTISFQLYPHLFVT